MQRLDKDANQEIELDCEPRAALELVAGEEPGLGKEGLELLQIAVQQHVFPRNERVVEDEDGVVLVEAGRQRIVERRAHDARHHLVGSSADELHAGRVHWRNEHHREIGVVGRHRRVLAEEIVMGERGCRGDDFSTGHVDAGVGLLLNCDEHVLDLIGRFGPVDRGIDDRVVHEQDVFLCSPIPR